MHIPVALLVFLGTVAVIMFLAYSIMPYDDGSKKRIKAVQARRDELYGIRQKQNQKKSSAGTFYTQTWIKNIIGKSSLGKAEKMSAYSAKLAQAGLRSHNAVWQVFFFKLVLVVALPVLAGMIFLLFSIDLKAIYKILIVLFLSLLGYIFPDMMISHVAEKRLIPIRKFFPDMLDMLVVCTEAGLSFESSLKRVSQEIFIGCPDLAEELAIMLVELNFFQERRIAFENLSKRIDLPQVRTFSNTLMQTEKFGTPVGQSLRVLSDEVPAI